MASKAVDREIYTISLPRRIPREIRDMEETERKRRMQEGVDPIMMAKMARVQRDLLMRVRSSFFNFSPIIFKLILLPQD